jgi:hypothetical protein
MVPFKMTSESVQENIQWNVYTSSELENSREFLGISNFSCFSGVVKQMVGSKRS